MKIIKHIIRGCGHLPTYGEHPGTIPLLMFLFIGFMAGSHNGLLGGLAGICFFAMFLLPPYLYGAYNRSKYDN